MYIKVDQFGGMRPQMAWRRLGMYEARRTHNARLWRGELQPYDAPLPVALPSKYLLPRIESIFPLNGQWLNWTTDVDVVRSPVSRDVHDRYYFTGDVGGMKTTTPALATTGGTDYPVTAYLTGMPAPLAGPGVAGTGNTGAVYAYRYKNEWNEVGALSAATFTANAATATITMAAPPAGGYNYNGLRYEVFRGDAVGALRYIGESATPTFTDNINVLSEVAPEVEYLPPATDLKGLVALPNGFLAAFRANEVWFSEPFQPHAWPEAYRLTFEDDIVAIGVYGTTLVVGTTGRPSVLSGVHPANMVEDKLDVQHACVSKRSMVTIGQGVAYAAPEGIVYVTGRSAQLWTENLMEKPDWTRFTPQSIVATTHDERYVGFYDPPDDDDRSRGGFVLDRNEPAAQFMLLTDFATAGYFDRATGETYLVIDNLINRFDSHHRQLQTYWRSKRYVLPRKVNFSVAKVRWTQNSALTLAQLREALRAGTARLLADEMPNGVPVTSGAVMHHPVLMYSVMGSNAVELIVRLAQQEPSGVTFRLWANDTLVHTEEPASSRLFRMPHGYGRHDEYWLEITGHQADIHEVVVAESPSELAAA